MRPIFGDTPSQRPRPSDNGCPTAFFIGDEDAVDAALEQSLSSFVTPRDPRKKQQQGVNSPTESGPSSPSKQHTATQDRDANVSATSSLPDSDDHPEDASLSPDRPVPLQQPALASASTETSRPITPLMLSLSGAASAISGASSRRNSIAASLSEEVASQALSMSAELQPELSSSSMMDSSSASQLVMPSIKMPSRRPFTDEGKRIGRLKILIAGDSGTGKTALIKAIVQTSDAIVHVDPITPQPAILGHRSSSSPRPKGRSRSTKTSNETTQISEISASTKPYPEWWSDLDDSRLLKRKKSLGGDTILDRNVCFIDTPGYSDGSSSMESITPVIRYIESHFEKVQSNASADSEMLNMLGGDGGNQVDVALYLIQNNLKPADLKYLQLLAPLTNVIPLLAQSDTMTPEAVSQSKERIRRELQEANVRPFSFATSASGGNVESASPYAISSLPGSDHDIMDASLLMSPDYVQPLKPSDLTNLVEQIFSESGASWLRHAAAKKFLQWKNSENPSRPRALYRPLSVPTGLPSASLVAAGAPRTYSLARIADHTQREERMAQIRLANWASDLQRSLANEKARYEALAQGERAIWLTERLNECVQDGTLVAVKHQDRSSSRLRAKRLSRERRPDSVTMHHQDPLGLLEVASRLKNNGWIALEVLGGVSILGGVVFWVSKTHGWHIQALEWIVESWSDKSSER
ncbi:hypothetical protein M406DRAFT_246793 [Cryphonectria parasitica EP155]|uniref:Septin-type G domain-containing protein n=1 Tax=Cryphonectria parasitica (strain ATCC 38755 / EP155) TaxID=660469 RepID=A0A9P4YBE7_CRYP1|nr:uncharacterized protein M406DRAFT_246793 [Cryphonectria parasitica EP155]KAF3770233.1 hypothetical protein M406DRAFT_246793 [Cryphonectria parasitica EP155]